MIQQTSFQALLDLKDSDTIGWKQHQVLTILKEFGPACNVQIAMALGWEINRVTPRTNELVKLGKVVEWKKDIGPTGRRVIFWKAL